MSAMLVRKGTMLHRNASRRSAGRRASRGSLSQGRNSSAGTPNSPSRTTLAGSSGEQSRNSLTVEPQRIRASSVGDPTSAGLHPQLGASMSPRPSNATLTVPAYGPYLNMAYSPSRGGSEPNSRRTSSCVSGDDRRQLCDESKLNDEAVMSAYGSIVYQMRDAHVDASGTCDFVFKALKILGRTGFVTLVLLIYTTLPFVQIVVGVEYLHDCPRQPNIPIYLLVGGCFGFLKMVWITCRQVRSRRYERLDAAFQEDNFEEIIGASSTKATDLALTVFLFIWTGLGTYWIYEMYIPNFEMEMFDPNNWCNRSVFYFTIVQLGIVYVSASVLLAIAFFFACYQRLSCLCDDRLK